MTSELYGSDQEVVCWNGNYDDKNKYVYILTKVWFPFRLPTNMLIE